MKTGDSNPHIERASPSFIDIQVLGVREEIVLCTGFVQSVQYLSFQRSLLIVTLYSVIKYLNYSLVFNSLIRRPEGHTCYSDFIGCVRLFG